MRFVGKLRFGFIGVLLLLGSFSFLFSVQVYAQEQTPDTTNEGYLNILRDGIIFANMQSDCVDTNCGTTAENCKNLGQCSLNQILQVFVNITIFILAISGSVILLMFVYGGYLWVTSRGDSKRIEKGKDTITQSVVGFAIILMAYSMINFLIAALAGDAPSATIEATLDKADDKNPDLNTAESP